MGSEHHIASADERMAGRRRLDREDVGTIAPQAAGIKGLGDGYFVHDRPAASVDQDRIRAHACQARALIIPRVLESSGTCSVTYSQDSRTSRKSTRRAFESCST